MRLATYGDFSRSGAGADVIGQYERALAVSCRLRLVRLHGVAGENKAAEQARRYNIVI